MLGPFALTHTEVVERRRLLLEKEAQERGRLVSSWSSGAAPQPQRISRSEREAELAQAPLPCEGGRDESEALQRQSPPSPPPQF